MAAADTARLIAALELDPRKFNSGVSSSMQGLGKLEGRLSNLGNHARRGVANAAANVAKIGAVAVGGLTVAITQGIDSLSQLEDATTAVDGAIRQVGLTGRVTSGQVAQWANEIEASVQAAFDDKDITRNAATLIRYGKVTASNLRPALVVMTDLAAKTGSVDSAATMLAKALADPAKAAGKLTRAGVVLTKQQQDYLKSLGGLDKKENERYKALLKVNKGEAERYKSGRLAAKQIQGQTFLLDQLSRATKGAGAASVGAFGDMKNKLQDTVEDAERLVAVGAMPVLQKLGDRITAALADPATMNDIKNLGQSAAQFLDEAIDFAGRIPWGQIKTALSIGGQGAKAILDAFTGMPDWVQTAVITGWGLNRLTGGALGDIVGEIGKSVIKGVLGMNAAVVNINAGVVNGAGGIPGGAGGAAGAAEGAAAAAGGGLLAGLSLIGGALAVVVVGSKISGLDNPDRLHDPVTGNVARSAEGSTPRSQLEASIAALRHSIETGERTDQLAKDQLADAVAKLAALGTGGTRDMDKNLAGNGAATRDMDKELRGAHAVLRNLVAIGIKVPANLDRLRDRLGAVLDKLHAANRSGRAGEAADLRAHARELKGRIDAASRAETAKIGASISAEDRIHAAAEAGAAATRSGTSGTTGAVNVARSSIVGAIAANRPIVSVATNVNVTASGVQKATTTSTRYGSQNGSAGGGGGSGLVGKKYS